MTEFDVDKKPSGKKRALIISAICVVSVAIVMMLVFFIFIFKHVKVYLHVAETVTEEQIRKGTVFAEPKDIEIPDDYDYAGWYTDKTYTTKYDFSKVVNKDTHLYLKLNPTFITVKFSANAPNGAVVSGFDFNPVTRYSYGQTFTFPTTIPTISDPEYHFNGWRLGSSSQVYQPGDVLPIENDTPNLVISAVWKGNDKAISIDYTNTVDANDEVIANYTGVVEYGSTYVAPNDAIYYFDHSKDFVGYKVVGEDAVYAPGEIIFNKVTGPFDLVLVWSDSLSYLTFVNNTTPETKDTLNYVAGYKFKLPTLNSTNQWVFAGWQDDDDVVYNCTDDYSMPATSTTLTAVFNKAEQTIHFNPNGADGTIADVVKLYSDMLELPDHSGLTYEYHKFIGWSVDPDATTLAECVTGDALKFVDLDAKELTLYAIWESTVTTISFDPNGGSGTVKVIENVARNVAYTGEFPTIDFTLQNYEIGSWNTDPSGEGTSYPLNLTSVAVGTEPVVLYAQWVAETKTINFIANCDASELTGGVTTTQTTTAKYTGTITLPQCQFARTDYVFNGWNTEADGSGTIYQPGNTYLVVNSTKQVNFYVMWFRINRTLATADDIVNDLAVNGGDARITYTQTKDISIADNVVIETLKAKYNGNNQTLTITADGSFVIKTNDAEITNLKIVNNGTKNKYTYEEVTYSSAFVINNNSNIKGVSVTTNDVTTDADHFGIIVANNYAFANIYGCSAVGNITTTGKHVGGVVSLNGGEVSSFGDTKTTFVGNITSTNESSDYGTGVGGIAGNNTGVMSNCVVGVDGTTYTISGANQVGGVVGCSSSISNCINYAKVVNGTEFTGSWGMGGIVGVNTNYVAGCYNFGEVSGYADIGGVVGQSNANEYSPGKIENCVNYGTINGGLQVAGISGKNMYTEIFRSGNNGNISATDDDSYVGGIVGISQGLKIQQCYNKGSVSGNMHVGGLGGQLTSTELNDSYNTATITGKDYVGGVVGYIVRYSDWGGALYRVYNRGTVVDINAGAENEDPDHVGQVAGYASTWVRTVCGLADVQPLVGDTTGFEGISQNTAEEKSLYVSASGVSTATDESEYTVLSVLTSDWNLYPATEDDCCWVATTDSTSFAQLSWENPQSQE